MSEPLSSWGTSAAFMPAIVGLLLINLGWFLGRLSPKWEALRVAMIVVCLCSAVALGFQSWRSYVPVADECGFVGDLCLP